MHTKSTVKYETFGGGEKGSETSANRIDKNSGFTHRPLQNRSEKPNSKQTWLKPQKEAHFVQKVSQTAARSQKTTPSENKSKKIPKRVPKESKKNPKRIQKEHQKDPIPKNISGIFVVY